MTDLEPTEKKIVDKAFEFVNSLLVSPAKEIGELFADQVRYIRFKNQINIINKAQKFLSEKNIDPRSVPIKTLANLIEYSSYEEDTGMQDKWAALLANSADPNNDSNLHNILAEILNQISPQESFLLDYLFNNSFIQTDRERVVMKVREIFTFKNISFRDSFIMTDNLRRLNLIEILPSEIENKDYDDDNPFGYNKSGLSEELDDYRNTRFRLSYLGIELVKECRFE
jgi:hypothetical protein